MTLAPQDHLEIGTAVSGSQSESMGTVVEVLTEPRDGRATWAWVAIGHAHGMVRAVPLGSAVRTPGGITVPFTKAFVAAATETVLPSQRERFPATLVAAEQDRLHAHYGLDTVGGPVSTRDVERTPFSRGRRLVFHGLLAVGLVWGAVAGLRPASRGNRS